MSRSIDLRRIHSLLLMRRKAIEIGIRSPQKSSQRSRAWYGSTFMLIKIITDLYKGNV